MTTTKEKERCSIKYWREKEDPAKEIACLVSNLELALQKKQKALEKLELRIQQLKKLEIKFGKSI